MPLIPTRTGNPYHPQPVEHFDYLGSSYRRPAFDTAYQHYQDVLHSGTPIGGGVKGYNAPPHAALHAAALALANAPVNVQWYDHAGHTIAGPHSQVVNHGAAPQYGVYPTQGSGGMAHGPNVPPVAPPPPPPSEIPVGPHPGPGWGLVPPGGFPPGVEPAPHWNPTMNSYSLPPPPAQSGMNLTNPFLGVTYSDMGIDPATFFRRGLGTPNPAYGY